MNPLSMSHTNFWGLFGSLSYSFSNLAFCIHPITSFRHKIPKKGCQPLFQCQEQSHPYPNSHCLHLLCIIIHLASQSPISNLQLCVEVKPTSSIKQTLTKRQCHCYQSGVENDCSSSHLFQLCDLDSLSGPHFPYY